WKASSGVLNRHCALLRSGSVAHRYSFPLHSAHQAVVTPRREKSLFTICTSPIVQDVALEVSRSGLEQPAPTTLAHAPHTATNPRTAAAASVARTLCAAPSAVNVLLQLRHD